VKFVTPHPQNALAAALLREGSKRVRAVIDQVPYEASVETRDILLKRIPKPYVELRKALEVGGVSGLGRKRFAYSVRAASRGRSVPASDLPSTVIYVTVKKKMLTRVLPATKILVEHSPWTLDTLPYQPDEKQAIVVSRKVNPKAVAQVRKLRKKDRRVWLKKMQNAGIREVRKDLRINPVVQAKAIPDVAFDSIRLEFGLGGLGSSPHWRPAVLALANGELVRRLRSAPRFVRALTDPEYRGWVRWPKNQAKANVSQKDVQTYVPFQQKLGIKVRG
jgi:hypothetical protein